MVHSNAVIFAALRLPLMVLLTALLLPISKATAEKQDYVGMHIDPLALYGSEVAFDVFRDGKKAGSHHVQFHRNGPDLTVNSIFHLSIDFLFFTAFRYTYESEDRWREHRLEGLSVLVDDNGARFAFDAHRDGESLRIDRNGEVQFADLPLYPTNHWNAGVIAQNRVLNTLTGRVNQVAIRSLGRELVETESGPVTSTRYAYSGDLETEVWYDDFRRWVKLRFAGRDGSTIEYICRRCQGTADPSMRQ